MIGLISVIVSWSCLLGLALFTPTALPAGGSEKYFSVIRRRHANEPLIAHEGCQIFVSPFSVSPALLRLKQGTPLRVLRSWQSSDGSYWIYVEAFSETKNFLRDELIRGWLNA